MKMKIGFFKNLKFITTTFVFLLIIFFIRFNHSQTNTKVKYNNQLANLIELNLENDNSIHLINKDSKEKIDLKEVKLKNGVSYEPLNKKFHIFLIWVGDKFPNLYMKAFETILYHHKDAQILIYSNELKLKQFSKYIKSGYDIKLVRYNLAEMTKNKLGNDFGLKANKLLNGEKIGDLQVTNVHISDFLRYFLLYNYGGLYIDTDMFVLRNLEHLKNSIGVDVNNSYRCHSKSYTVGNTKNFSCLCNCFLSFDKNHPFLEKALINYESSWSKLQGYGPGGAVLLIRLVENHLNDIHFYDVNNLVCNRQMRAKFDKATKNDPRVLDALQNCYVYHLYSAAQKPDDDKDDFSSKFIGQIYKKFKLYL